MLARHALALASLVIVGCAKPPDIIRDPLPAGQVAVVMPSGPVAVLKPIKGETFPEGSSAARLPWLKKFDEVRVVCDDVRGDEKRSVRVVVTKDSAGPETSLAGIRGVLPRGELRLKDDQPE